VIYDSLLLGSRKKEEYFNLQANKAKVRKDCKALRSFNFLIAILFSSSPFSKNSKKILCKNGLFFESK
jgi:hypothetical protein